MKFKIETVYDGVFWRGTDEYDEIASNIRDANLKVIEVKTQSKNDRVGIYTEINSLEELNRLVEAFGCHIVYGDKTADGVVIIEKYDTWRE